MTVIIVTAAVVLIAVIAYLLTQRRGSDGVANFQRQIDALSSEARRPVVNQVQRAVDDEPQDDNDGEEVDSGERDVDDDRGDDR